MDMTYKLSKNPEFILGFSEEVNELGFVSGKTFCAKVIGSKAKSIVKKLQGGDSEAISMFAEHMWELE